MPSKNAAVPSGHLHPHISQQHSGTDDLARDELPPGGTGASPHSGRPQLHQLRPLDQHGHHALNLFAPDCPHLSSLPDQTYLYPPLLAQDEGEEARLRRDLMLE